MNKLPILIKREFWQYRNTFVIVPLVTTAFFALMMLVVFTVSTSDFLDMTIDLDHDVQHQHEQQKIKTDDPIAYALLHLERMSAGEREEKLNAALQAMSVPLVMILWFVVFFYLLACLYEDRKDRSILFWKSLPVSDTMTILSKLLTALFVVPLVYLLGIATLQLLSLILLTLSAIGSDISIWETIWVPANIFGNWFRYIGVVVFYSFWALPFFAWLLAVSSFAKSVPLVWALGIPLGVTITERIFTNQSALADWIGQHTVPVRFIADSRQALANAGDVVFSLQMLSAIVVGVAFIFLAIWLRGRADEI